MRPDIPRISSHVLCTTTFARERSRLLPPVQFVHLHPALPRPPEREEEEGGHDEGRDLRRIRIEPTDNERGTDE